MGLYQMRRVGLLFNAQLASAATPIASIRAGAVSFRLPDTLFLQRRITMSNSKRLQRVLELCGEVLDQPGAERVAYLAEACEGDFRLRAAVESVLVALKDARQFMDVADIRADNFADYVGENAGDYALDELLGISPLGAVYKASDEHGSTFAVRVVRGHLWARELIERFTDELDIYSRVRHPGIAALLDGGVTVNGSPYLVYEFVHGEPIDQYCDRAQLDVRQRVELMATVCEAAHVGHTYLSAWRSLRPSNILVTADGHPKILDFALSTLMHRQHGPVRSNDSALLSMWMSEFAAPETFDDIAPSTRADVYSLGAMLFELLSGQRRPSYPLDKSAEVSGVRSASEQVRDNPDDDLREAIAHRRSTSSTQLQRALSGSLDALIDRATHVDPRARFDSATSLAQALSAYLQGRTTDSGPAAQGFVVPSARRVRSSEPLRAFGFGITAGIVLLALFAAVYFARG
jgi:serine/threonine-protein kinase